MSNLTQIRLTVTDFVRANWHGVIERSHFKNIFFENITNKRTFKSLNLSWYHSGIYRLIYTNVAGSLSETSKFLSALTMLTTMDSFVAMSQRKKYIA